MGCILVIWKKMRKKINSLWAGAKDVFLFIVLIPYLLYLGYKYLFDVITDINDTKASTGEDNDFVFLLLMIFWLMLIMVCCCKYGL